MNALTEQEQAEILANRAKVKALLPDMLPFFKELSDLGMIPGWRCVRRVRLFTDPVWPPENITMRPLSTGREFCKETL